MIVALFTVLKAAFTKHGLRAGILNTMLTHVGREAAERSRHYPVRRLCGALRRMDVLHEDEMDEEEYAEAAAAAAGAASSLSLLPAPFDVVAREGRPAQVGWMLPWALRARVAERLLFGASFMMFGHQKFVVACARICALMCLCLLLPNND